MDLLKKIHSVKVESTSNLPEQDKNFCENIHNQFSENLSEIEIWRNSLNSLLQENGNPNFIVYEKRYNNEEKSVYEKSTKLDESNPFYKNRFSILHAIEKLDKIENLSVEIYVRSIFKYFNNKYNLNFSMYKTDWQIELTTKITYPDVISYIQKSVGSLNFTAIGIENLKEEFRETIWWQEKLKIQKNKLVIADYIRYSSYSWDNTCQFKYDMKHHGVRKALFFFEAKHLDFKQDMEFMLTNEYIDFSKIYSCSSLKKLKGIKFFKNGKIEIQFIDENTAQEFYDFFELRKIDDRK